jgi:endonuclease/exonuclease/phosphatase family metal-dependent hydrolase
MTDNNLITIDCSKVPESIGTGKGTLVLKKNRVPDLIKVISLYKNAEGKKTLGKIGTITVCKIKNFNKNHLLRIYQKNLQNCIEILLDKDERIKVLSLGRWIEKNRPSENTPKNKSEDSAPFTSNASSGSGVMNALRVLTWNLGIGKGGSWEVKEFEKIWKIEPEFDVIFFQEVPFNKKNTVWKDTITDKAKEKYHIFKQQCVRNDDTAFILITLIKKDLFRIGSGFLDVCEFDVRELHDCTTKKNYSLIVSPKNNPKLGLINVHLSAGLNPLNRKTRKSEARGIRKFKFDHVLLAGDFNCEQVEAEMLAKIMVPRIDLLPHSGGTVPYTFSAYKTISSITTMVGKIYDWIFFKDRNLHGTDAMTFAYSKSKCTPHYPKAPARAYGRHYPVGTRP